MCVSTWKSQLGPQHGQSLQNKEMTDGINATAAGSLLEKQWCELVTLTNVYFKWTEAFKILLKSGGGGRESHIFCQHIRVSGFACWLHF